MDRTPGEIEADLALPEEIVSAALWFIVAQDAERGCWTSPREAAVLTPPWPEVVNPMLELLVKRAEACVAAGTDLIEVLRELAVDAWFEGGVENYDRGQRDARRPRLA